MAGEDGRANHPLVRRLVREPHRFSFFQAVRLLQDFFPEAPRVGEQGPPRDEVIRFQAGLGFHFPPCDVAKITRLVPGDGLPSDQDLVNGQQRVAEGVEGEREDEEQVDASEEGYQRRGTDLRFRFANTFLGLYGVSSPLPNSYTEDLLDQEPNSLERGFYDLFQHRLHSLFFRSWERYRYPVRFRRDGEDYFSQRLSTLVHVSRGQLPAGHGLPMLRLLSLAGLLSQEPRSATSLLAALGYVLPEASFEVEPFVGRKLPIPEEQQCRLGRDNHALGETAHLGARILDRCSTFRLVVETDRLEHYLGFLPGGELLPRLREVVDLFNTDRLDCQLEVRITAEAVPPLRLGAPSAHLGWSTWLGAPPAPARRVRILLQGALHGRR